MDFASHIRGLSKLDLNSATSANESLEQDGLFFQLFQKLNDDSKENKKTNNDHLTADVGNPTVGCHQDGGSEEDPKEEEKFNHTVITDSETDTNPDKRNDKGNNNCYLTGVGAAFCSPRDRRIFIDFETAGLPKKEIDRLAQALHESVLAGRESVSVGICVPELGELRFDVRIAGKVVFIHAFVENEHASAALALAISTLRAKLEEHQLILGRLDVTTRSTKRDSRKESHNGPSSGRKTKIDLLPSLKRMDGLMKE